jgi:hypothetical protein
LSIPEEIEKRYRLEVEEVPGHPIGWHWRILDREAGAVEREGPMAYADEADAWEAGRQALEKHARYKLLGTLDDWT